jgi:DNA-binding transcriptional regulator YiaG
MIKKQLPMNNELKILRATYNLTQDEMAKLIYVSSNTWHRWETKRTPITQASWELLQYKLHDINKQGGIDLSLDEILSDYNRPLA